MIRVWMGGWEGGTEGGLSLHPRPQKSTRPPQRHEKSPYEDLAVLPASD